MANVPRVTPQAGKGGAELPQLGALARYAQDAIGQAGAPVAYVAGVQASGTVKVSANGSLAATDTLTVGASTLTFVANGSTPGDLEIEIGADANGTAANIKTALDAVAAAEGIITTVLTDTVTVKAAAAGAAGNAIVLAATLSVGGLTVSGSGTLENGVTMVPGTPAPAGSIRVDGQNSKAYIAVKDCTEVDTSGWMEITIT